MTEARPASDPHPDPAGKVVGLFHGGVTVTDLDQAVAFYRDILGFELAARRDATEDYLREMHTQPFTKVRMAFMAIPNSATMIELIEYQGVETHAPAYQPSDPSTGHLCFLVDDIHAVDARLRAAGVRSRSTGPVQITAGPNLGGWAVYFHDPEGYPIEFIQQAQS